MMYKQTLVETLTEYIPSKVYKKKNRYKQWKYGYDKENDLIVISKTGTIGEIIKIQNVVMSKRKVINTLIFKDLDLL